MARSNRYFVLLHAITGETVLETRSEMLALTNWVGSTFLGKSNVSYEQAKRQAGYYVGRYRSARERAGVRQQA